MKMSKYKKLIIIATLISMSPMATKAVTIEHCGETGMRVSGSIEMGDLGKIQKSCLNTKIGQTSIFTIASEGGDVAESMKIGRWLRANKMTVAVPDGRVCYSACVYVVAAGVVRYAWGDIGIHRPYFLTKPNESYDISLKRILVESKKYFAEMNVQERLAEDMFSTPAHDMRILNDEELNFYRLSQTDMAYEEERTIENAKAYGLTRAEYTRRLQLAEKYAKECRQSAPAPRTEKESTSLVVECFDRAYKKAGLIIRNK